jgi:hypothetical protein
MKLTKKWIVEGDPLFFFQLLLPIGDPKKSGIENDPCLPYYSEVECWTQKYATSIGLGRSYCHSLKEIMLEELLHFNSVVIRDGVHGRMDGAIYCRWREGETMFDKDVAKSISHTHWLQLKRTYKLYGNDAAPKKGGEGYNTNFIQSAMSTMRDGSCTGILLALRGFYESPMNSACYCVLASDHDSCITL